MIKKLALLLAMSGISLAANGAETLMIEATYQEPMFMSATTPGELSTHYEANCKIYDNGKATVNLNKYDYDDAAAQAALQAANYTDIDKNQFKKNSKTIISTSTKFTIDATFLKDAVNEAVLYSELPGAYPIGHEFFVYKNKKKMKAGTTSSSNQVYKSEKLNLALTAMCNQHGLRQSVVDGYYSQ